MSRLIENLESRRMLSVALFNGGTLKVAGLAGADNAISVSLSSDAKQVVVSLNGSSSTFDAAKVKRLQVLGGALVDTVTLGASLLLPAVIDTLAGNDVVTAGAGKYRIETGEGADTVTVGDGKSVVQTGAGADVVTVGNGKSYVNGGAGADKITAGNGGNVLRGGADNDTITSGSGADYISADVGDDVVFAGAGNNVVRGGMGDDSIVAEGGNDLIQGGAGNDTLVGGAGNDTLVGGAGDDTQDGGSGSNSFWGFSGTNILTAAPGHGDVNTYRISSTTVISPEARTVDIVIKRPTAEPPEATEALFSAAPIERLL